MQLSTRRWAGLVSAVGLTATSTTGTIVAGGLDGEASAQPGPTPASTPAHSIIPGVRTWPPPPPSQPLTQARVRASSAAPTEQPLAQASTVKSPCGFGANGGGFPMPQGFLRSLSQIDQGVDYPAPGGTPLCAMGSGKVIQEGINGFGPNAPVLQITGGPLAGSTVYYGHSGNDLVGVGAQVANGQQISSVGSGIVGLSTGPHLEIGFWAGSGPVSDGHGMLNYINKQLRP